MIRVLFGEGKVVRKRAEVNTFSDAFFIAATAPADSLIHPETRRRFIAVQHRFSIPHAGDRLRP